MAEIRERMARSQGFRGFASGPVALSGILALAGAAIQPVFVPSPLDDLSRYLILWCGLATFSVAVAGVGLWSWTRRRESELRREKTRLAIEGMTPSLVVGAVMTFFVARDLPEVQRVGTVPGVEDLRAGCLDARPMYPDRRAALARAGLSPRFAGPERHRAPITTHREARRAAGPMHSDVRTWLDRRQTWSEPERGPGVCR